MKNLASLGHVPFLVLLVIALGIGFYTAPDYGESWDEPNMYSYVNYALDDLRFLRHPAELANYGRPGALRSAFYIAGGLAARSFAAVNPAWSLPTAWHYVYFVTFLLGAGALYFMATRWMSTASALAATLLYMSQPVFWGHAFINPKDIPFLTFFAVALHTGFQMTDKLRVSPHPSSFVIVAAMALGIASSFRVAGPFAGLIVLGYAAHKLRSKAIVPALAYVGIAAVTVYLSWPYLWGAPVSRYLGMANQMAHFDWDHGVLFAGQIYQAPQLPATFFPTLIGIQLTEPAVLLCAGGLVLSVVEFMRGRAYAPLILILAWCLAPALLIIGMRSTLYDNGRQLYFLLPPLFLGAGLAFECIFSLARQPAIRALVIVVAILPGAIQAIRLHPYEYVYYNALIGGTAGAYGVYEMDYWGTSFQEMAEYLNSIAIADATVKVYGPTRVIQPYARQDLHLVTGPSVVDGLPVLDVARPQPAAYDYRVLLIRARYTGHYCEEAPIVHTVGRMGAVFSILRGSPQDGACR